MRSRFKRIVLLSMIVLVVLVPSVSAAEAPVPGPSGGQDVRVQPEVSGVTIDLTLPDYKIEDVVRDGVTYQQIAVDADGWAQAGQPGAPQLPERGMMVAVPPTGDVSLQILDVTPAAAPGSYRLQPAPLASLQEDQLVETWQADPVKYCGSGLDARRTGRDRAGGLAARLSLRALGVAALPDQPGQWRAARRVDAARPLGLQRAWPFRSFLTSRPHLCAGLLVDLRQLRPGEGLADTT